MSFTLTPEDTRQIEQWCKDQGYECSRRPYVDASKDELVIYFENGARLALPMEEVYLARIGHRFEIFVRYRVEVVQGEFKKKPKTVSVGDLTTKLADLEASNRSLRATVETSVKTAEVALERLQRAEEVIERVRALVDEWPGGYGAFDALEELIGVYDSSKPS